MPPSSHPPPPQHHLILIHGAWAGSWVWDSVQPILQALDGYLVHAVDLPGHHSGEPDVTLDTYCQHVQTIVADIPPSDRVSIIAHSGAGVIALQVAENLSAVMETCAPHGSIHSLVIVAGMLLPSGMTYTDFRATLPSELSEEPLELVFTPDGSSSTVPLASALQCFFQDFPDPALAQQAACRLRAQPTGGLAIAAVYQKDGTMARSIPKLYVHATRDASVRFPVQQAMVETARANGMLA